MNEVLVPVRQEEEVVVGVEDAPGDIGDELLELPHILPININK